MTKKVLIQLFFASVVFLIILIGSVCVNYPGILHPEAELRIPSYLANRPLLTKIFDVNANDSTWYQAREISYVFEIADVYFIRWCAQLGFPHFLSLSNYVSMFALSILIVYVSLVYFKQRHPAIPLLLGVIFLTSPAAFLGVFFYRSSKEMLSLLLVILVLLTLRYVNNRKNGCMQMILLFSTAFAASLFDRQGFYIITLCSALCFFMCLYTKDKRHFNLFLLFLAASLANCLYNFLLGPLLIHHFAGYWPDFSYQMGWGNPATLTAPANFFMVFTWPQLSLGGEYLLQTFSFLLGNIPQYVLVPLLLLFCYLLYVALSRSLREHTKKKTVFIICIILASILAMIFLNGTMLIRHTGMMLPDVIRLFYMLPAYTICIIAANYVLADQWVYRKRNAVGVTLGLLLITVLNIAALPGHRAIVRDGIFIKQYVAVTPDTIHCIKHTERPVSEFKLPWPKNSALCEALRK